MKPLFRRIHIPSPPKIVLKQPRARNPIGVAIVAILVTLMLSGLLYLFLTGASRKEYAQTLEDNVGLNKKYRVLEGKAAAMEAELNQLRTRTVSLEQGVSIEKSACTSANKAVEELTKERNKLLVDLALYQGGNTRTRSELKVNDL